jgi:Arc/MetJ-type ribon-helix-helix transcriptional regulator
MKVSVSLPEDDVEFLDEYAQEQGFGSRSAVLHKAVRLLRAAGLTDAYEEAWHEWDAAGEEAVWDGSTSDGMSP